MVASAGLDVVVSSDLLVVFSAGFDELVAGVLAIEDVLLEDVPDEVLDEAFSEEVSSDEVLFIAEGSTSSKTLPPCVVQGLS